MEKCDILPVIDGWVHCPVCRTNKRLLKLLPESRGQSIVIFCKVCKSEFVVDVDGQSVKRRNQ